MREILFRGKRADNGEWVEGYLVYSEHSKAYYIHTNKTAFAVEVIPETVGQYTGLKDKNGKRIFEGDILESRYDRLFPDDCVHELVIWKDNGWCISCSVGYDCLDEDSVLEYSEVAGNVHDNPELLKGGASE